MKWIAAVCLVCLSCTIALADQADYTIIGRTSQVIVTWENFQDEICACAFNGTSICTPTAPGGCFQKEVRVLTQVIVPAVSPLPQEMGGACTQDIWGTCSNLSTMLGWSCNKTMFTSHQGFAGTRVTSQHYQCAIGPQAQCVRLTGHLTPGIRVEHVGLLGGCIY